MSDDELLERQVRARLHQDLADITPRPGSEFRLYRGMEQTRPQAWWSRWASPVVVVPIAAAVAVVFLVIVVPLLTSGDQRNVEPAGNPRPSSSCPVDRDADRSFPQTLGCLSSTPGQPGTRPTEDR